MSDERTRREARAGWSARVVRPGEDEEALDAEFWQRILLEERAETAWRLSFEAWSLAEPGVDHERRLSRSVAHVVRR